MQTSLVVPAKAVAIKMHHVVGDNVIPTNPASSLHKQNHVQSGANRTPVPFIMLPCTMDGVHAEENTHVSGVEIINKHDISHASLLKVAIHLLAFALSQ
jgi:hypothetical protein